MNSPGFFLLTGCISFFVCFTAVAQPQPKRTIHFQHIGKDSVKLHLNEEYYLIEDSCAQIVRYARYDFKQRIFTGKFKDANYSNPDLVVSEGNYNDKGLKNGMFISHYLNGNLQATGSFKDNQFAGKWDLFYDDGKPKLSFEANGNDIKIIDAWNDEGKKTVDNGNGVYKADLGSIYWTGKLVNGRPDGKWKAVKTNDRTNTELVNEHFKDGVFQKGKGPDGDYKDVSRIILVIENQLPFVNAEKLRISPVPCNGVKRKQIINAQYRGSLASFSEEIKRLAGPYLNKADLKSFDTELVLTGEIGTNGFISTLTYSGAFDDKIASGLTMELRRLPPLEPALVDGKPVPQQFIITFKFRMGGYSFGYRLLPIK
ncbi:MAG TPA: hypothetical protein VF487_04815 [Chitinophagaceae bacterium]